MLKRISYLAAIVSGTLISVVNAEVTTLSGSDYANRCQTLGVPLPPRWGENVAGKPKWLSNGKIAGDAVFIVQRVDANVYYYSNPQGVCMALPRYNSGATSADLVGVICQGTTGKVCFWDSKTPVPLSPSKPLSITSTVAADLTASPWIGGAALATHRGGMCTDCHRGENPFIVMPGSATDLTSKGISVNTGKWYEPIVPAKYGDLDWFQNPGPGTTLNNVAPGPGEQSCTVCHTSSQAGRFPRIERLSNGGVSRYCNDVLYRSRDLKKMPPVNSTASYAAHWNALVGACLSPATMTTTPTPISGRNVFPSYQFVAID